MGALENLAKKFATFCERQESLLAVSLEELFEGKDVRYSMGANLSDDEHPGTQGFYRILTCPAKWIFAVAGYRASITAETGFHGLRRVGKLWRLQRLDFPRAVRLLCPEPDGPRA